MTVEARRLSGRALVGAASLAAFVATAGAILAAPADSIVAPSTGQAPRIERKTAHPGRRHHAAIPAATPLFQSLSDRLPAAPGERIRIMVRLFGGTGAARRAAFHLTTNPALVRYVESAPTGGGALIVRASRNPGELVVYRSSTPGGFAQTETLVELEFEAVAPGTTTILLTGVRLFDGGARDLQASYESGTLVIE
ncbi:MAG: hypothetical protein HY049_06425 [Acidobacteria bacterium]|nr:hypothetical protein [Acidobacteriota bacterium]